MVGVLLYIAWKNTELSKDTKKKTIDIVWEFVMIGMIVIPMILRILRIK
jgi:hypothetical protein